MNKKLKIGIIGCGTIGTEIAKASLNLLKEKIDLVAIYDIDQLKLDNLERNLNIKVRSSSMKELFQKSDIAIESASQATAPIALKEAIESKKDILIMSVGGLLGNESLLKKAENIGIKVYLPSGALAGIDAIKAGRIAKIESVTLTTKKPPKGLEGAPYIKNNNIDLSTIKEDTVIFEGNALEAVKAFPKNVNVSAILSIVGIGANSTKVKILVSPTLKRNVHMVEVKGDFGTIKTETVNVPSPANPKTSYLAVLSAIAKLKTIADSVIIGT